MERFVFSDESITEMAKKSAEETRSRLTDDGFSEEEIVIQIKWITEDLYNQFKQLNDELKVFISDTDSDDELQVILRGHLYIEREITGMLRIILEYPDEILSDRFMFMNKVNLAVALGIIKKEDKSVLNKVNSLRNKLAHKLNYSCNEKDYSGLSDSLRGKLKNYSANHIAAIAEEDLLTRIKNIIGVIWIYVKNEHDLIPLKLRNESLRQETANTLLRIRDQEEKLKLLSQDTK
ncbi:hypothetical protein [Sporosarcina psychrophila]|uniref:MAE-28990/MAE-18760-like HEPN domain-containing protein n=1 Tax=Sporosarcina psychrophila TaxID=1476 RepID=A0ABV2K9Q1_SPOPS